MHDFVIVYLCRRKRNIPASHLKKIETKTNMFIDLTSSTETFSVTLHLRYGILGKFLTLVTTNITVITIGGHKNVRTFTTKGQVLLQLLRPEEDYQLVLLPG